jgi:hypothetical protein
MIVPRVTQCQISNNAWVMWRRVTVWVAGTNAGFHAICLVGMGAGKVRVHDPGLPAPKTWGMKKLMKYYVPPAVKI